MHIFVIVHMLILHLCMLDCTRVRILSERVKWFTHDSMEGGKVGNVDQAVGILVHHAEDL